MEFCTKIDITAFESDDEDESVMVVDPAAPFIPTLPLLPTLSTVTTALQILKDLQQKRIPRHGAFYGEPFSPSFN